jgi:hypothetical protein
MSSTLDTRNIFLPDISQPQSSSTIALALDHSQEALRGESVHPDESCELPAFDLARQFIEQMEAQSGSFPYEDGHLPRRLIDWAEIEGAMASSRSVEQAIGRAVVVANRMCRAGSHGSDMDDGAPSSTTDGPFFSFDVFDAVPDFGDESRYRTRVAKRLGRMFRTRQPASRGPIGSPFF